jgi:serine/threonine protein kinase/Tfp pilus assembly protein PilF
MIGQVFSGRYEIIQEFSQDEFSQTYLAQDKKRHGSPVCLVKEFVPRSDFLKEGDREFLQQIFRLFQQQAEILKQLGHSDRFPKLLAYFQYQGKFYIVQEFIEGRPLLDELVPGQPLSEEQVSNLLAELLESLALIHFYQINHGNIHPNNIIRRNQNQQLVLTDFAGFKQMLSQNPTVSGKVAGYQRSKLKAEIKAETCLFSDDIYAVGIIAIQALTGIPAEQLPRNPKNHKIIWKNIWKNQEKVKNRQLVSILNLMIDMGSKQRHFSIPKALKTLKKFSQTDRLVLQPTIELNVKNQLNFFTSNFGKILGIIGIGSALAFLLMNESVLYFIRYPQASIYQVKRADAINQSAALASLDIIQANSPDIYDASVSQEVAEKVKAIATEITIQIKAENKQKGSGAIVAKSGNQYYVLTAKHVVSKIDTYTVVTPDGKSYAVENERVRKIGGVDLAILQFTSEENYPVATLANAPLNYNIDDDKNRWVFLSGWPIVTENKPEYYEFNLGQLFSQEIALLNITDPASLNQGYELLYTNFSKAGVSGGPVLDTQGRLIGIHGAARVDRVNNVQLGDSLGVPIAKFLAVVNLLDIPPDSFKVETTPPAEISPQNEGENQINLSNDSGLTVSQPADKTNHRHWVNYGNQLWRMGLNEAAIQAFDEAIKIQPDFYPAWYLRGLVLTENKQYTEALTSFDRVLKLEPKFLQVWAERGKVLAQLGEYSKAVNSIDQGIKRQPKNLLFHWLHGNWLYRSKQYVKAIAAYSRALKIKPHPFAYYNRGVAHYFMHNYSQAIADYNQALQMKLNIGEIYLARSLAYTAQGNAPKAAEDLAKAKQIFCVQNSPKCEKIEEK